MRASSDPSEVRRHQRSVVPEEQQVLENGGGGGDAAGAAVLGGLDDVAVDPEGHRGLDRQLAEREVHVLPLEPAQQGDEGVG